MKDTENAILQKFMRGIEERIKSLMEQYIFEPADEKTARHLQQTVVDSLSMMIYNRFNVDAEVDDKEEITLFITIFIENDINIKLRFNYSDCPVMTIQSDINDDEGSSIIARYDDAMGIL